MNKVPGLVTGLTLFENEKPKPCSFPNKQLVVDSSGDILPCCKLWGKELSIGNIADMTLKEAWKSEKMKQLRKAHSKRSKAGGKNFWRIIADGSGKYNRKEKSPQDKKDYEQRLVNCILSQ